MVRLYGRQSRDIILNTIRLYSSMPKDNASAGIFANLGNLAYKRSNKQAAGFYIAYFFAMLLLVVGITVPFLVVLSFAGFIPSEALGVISVLTGWILSLIFILVFGILILRAKNQMSDFASIFILLLALVFTALIGGILGMIPIAYLTKKEIKK